jgi:DNA-binding Lrp family transcriptional regulator
MKAYISLTCKTGAYNRVLNELLKMKVPRGDVFLLFGPVDILIQFKELENLDEFVENWFNPVRMIGAEETLITKTLTFIVISEGPSFVEEPFAFVFLNAQPRNLEKVQEALLAVPEVLSADTVFGPYDIICAIGARDTTDLERIVRDIQKNIPGIEGSMTAVVALMRV